MGGLWLSERFQNMKKFENPFSGLLLGCLDAVFLAIHGIPNFSVTIREGEAVRQMDSRCGCWLRPSTMTCGVMLFCGRHSCFMCVFVMTIEINSGHLVSRCMLEQAVAGPVTQISSVRLIVNVLGNYQKQQSEK